MNEPMNHAIVENGIIANVIWVLPDQAHEFGAILLTNEAAGIGWKYENGEFIAPEEQTENVPEE